MRGVILALAPDGSYGQLSADDGQRYSYWTSEVRNGRAQVGQMVDFQMWEGQPIEIFVLANPTPPQAPPRAGMPRPASNAGPQGAPYAGAPAAYAAQPAPYTPGPDRFGASASSFPPAEYWIKLFTSPFGRISRLQFWLHGVLPVVVVSILLGWIPLINILVFLATWWASICISFKRFHDVGYPGWWSLIGAIPFLAAMVVLAGSLFMGGLGGWRLAAILYGIGGIIFIVQLIFVYCRVGQQGPNGYGEDPLGG
jgi:uncharacterized membrane protein YhaH (DUF805 family)